MIDQNRYSDSELRQATVLFADISGFTAMSENMHPEEITELINQCFSMMGKCIESHGGRIDKFIGDCIMVVFGVPETVEKATHRAISSALEIRDRLYEFNRDNELGVPLDVHIGINSGTVLAGMVGSDNKKEYTVMGDTVNLASRLEDASMPGQILVGLSTFHATRNEFNYNALPPITLKGKKNTVPVFELLSAKTRSTVSAAFDGRTPVQERSVSSRIVGRNREMDILRNMARRLMNGEGGIVTIQGEAGLGKSRLMAEIISDPVLKPITFLEGKAVSMGQNLSFHPIIDMLKNHARIGEDDSEKESLGKLEKFIRSINPEKANVMISFIGMLMRLNLPDEYASTLHGIGGEAMEKNIFINVRELFSTMAGLYPLVIYFEDLHWADNSTIDLLLSMLCLAEKKRILFITVFRPGYEMTGNRLINAVRELTRCQSIDITLEPLDENESMLLIENLLNIKGFPHSIREQIRARAGGNPFFIEEVIRSFIDQGILTLRNGNFDITDKVSNAEIPLTINEVIMSRIDRLDRETKDLLKTASVIGRSFFYKIITAVAQNINDIDMQLGHLKEIQLIRERRRMDELEYLFKHALTQETAYNSLLIQQRRDIHLHVAQAIEQLFSERLQEFYGMLAWHYNLGDNSDKTEYYLIRAGEESLKASASSEAVYFYKQALGLYRKKYGERADPEKIAMLEKNIGIALFNKGLYEECIEYMDRSLAYYGEHIPHHPVAMFRKTVRDLLLLILRLYVPTFRWKYKPTDNDREILHLLYKKCQALAVTDPASFFIHGIYLSRRLFGVDISKLDDDIGAGLIPSGSALFSYTGISFSLCRKIIRLVTGKIDMNNQRSVLAYNFAALLENTMSGSAPYAGDYDNDLVDRNIVTGEFFFLSSFFYWFSASCIERGDFSKIDTVRDKYSVMNNEYGNVFAGVNKYNMYTLYLMKTRNISEGLQEADEGIAYVSEKPEFSLDILSEFPESYHVHSSR